MSFRLFIASLAFCAFNSGFVFAQAPLHANATTQASRVLFLLDEEAVFGAGHAAVLVGDQSGWDYFSFGPQTQKKSENFLVHQHFDTLAEARESKDLRRYNKYLSWSSKRPHSANAVRQRVLKVWDHSRYDLLTRNCFTMVADTLQAGSFNIDPNNPVPFAAFSINIKFADGHGSWPNVER